MIPIFTVMRRIMLLIALLLPIHAYCQHLKPGFDKEEYIELLKIAHLQHVDISFFDTSKLPAPAHSKLVYRSPVMGLENIWDLWMKDGNTGVISVRGTTASQVSWLANFYAAMVPATGQLKLVHNYTFTYSLSDNPRAAVHVGWLLAMGYLSRDILPRIDSCYKSGIRDFIVTGHSQGAGISFLLTSYLYDLQAKGRMPADIRFKTYCSAAPKPGNLYYAYSYEHTTNGGWAYTVVNSADWVPETPVSVQTVNDLNNTNAFKMAPKLIKQQKFPKNLVMRHIYNRLSKPSLKAQRNYEKYLGRMVSKMVKKQLKGFEAPNYYSSDNYVRTGNTIVLYADSEYFKKYPDNTSNIWIHHFIGPYLFLAEKL